MIREQLKHMNVHVDGRGYVGLATAMEVPKPEAIVREFSGGGMSGAIEVNQGKHGVLQASITFGGLVPEVIGAFGMVEGADLPFVCRGSTEDRDGTTHAHKVVMRGFIKMIDEGDWGGDDVGLKIDLSLRHYERHHDGVELLAMNPEAMIFRRNGVDQLARHRANIGR
jgi:P2 family phage contractile tail tube protein